MYMYLYLCGNNDNVADCSVPALVCVCVSVYLSMNMPPSFTYVVSYFLFRSFMDRAWVLAEIVID